MNVTISKPFYSVVVPLYNKAPYIQRCLASVLAQTFTDFELVVVDDGSTDKGQVVVESCQDQRVRLIRQSNGGVSAARNRGIAEARGEWIAFLDADDEFQEHFLEKTRGCIAKFPEAGAVYSRTTYLKGKNQLNVPHDMVKSPLLLADYLAFVAFQKGYEIHSSAVAVRRDVFPRAGLFPLGIKVGEDSDMWLRLAWTTKIAYIPESLSTYHMGAGASNWEAQRETDAFWISTYRKWRNEGRIPRHLLRSSMAYYQKYLLEKALLFAHRGNRAKTRSILWKDVAWFSAPKSLAAKCLLYAYAPAGVVNLLRSIKNSGC